MGVQLVESAVRYTNKLNKVEHLLETNEELSSAIVKHGLRYYNITQTQLDEFIRENELKGRVVDRTSVAQAMKHFVRDWATDGHHEREQAFPCILNLLASTPRTSKRPQQVLVPGAGLGRLAYEIDALGGKYR